MMYAVIQIRHHVPGHRVPFTLVFRIQHTQQMYPRLPAKQFHLIKIIHKTENSTVWIVATVESIMINRFRHILLCVIKNAQTGVLSFLVLINLHFIIDIFQI